MRNRFSFFLILTCLSFTSLFAQEFSGGFRAGLNFNTLAADAETCEQCMDVDSYESFNRTTGFHVAATFALAFTDLVGIKADLMYNQKGVEKRFDGPSFFYLYADENDVEGAFNFANLNGEVNYVNSYIDIPVTAYYRLGKFEVEGGVSMGFMVNSRASGGLTYETDELSPFGNRVFVFNVDGSLYSDEAGGGGVVSRGLESLPGASQPLPDVISGYYNSNSNEPLYRRLDFGLVVGASVYLNNGLFIGARYQHGLTDVTNGENDLRITNEAPIAGREFNTDDEDYNRSIQASVGFRF